MIRASCDNCAKSKVRCSKDQPRCHRCVYQGVPCKYSPSQKCRKRTLSSTNTESQVSWPSGRSRETAPRFGNASSTRTDLVSFRTPNVEPSANGRQDEREFKKPSTDSDHRDLSTVGLFSTDVDPFLKWGHPVMSPEEQWQSRPETATMPDPPTMPPWMSPRRSEPYVTLDDPDLTSFWSLPTKEPTSPTHDKPSQSRKTSSLEPHRCSLLAISTIQRLESPFEPCASFAPDPTTLAGGESRSLDAVLKDNRAAIDTLRKILNCSCTARSDLILLVATIGLRALTWYQASLERSASNVLTGATPSLLSASTPAAETTPGSSTSCLVGWVSIPAINIGDYRLEGDHSDRMVAQFILAELSEMKEVIDIFAHKYCQRADRMSSLYSSRSSLEPEGSDNRLYVELEALLRSRLKRAVLTTREQLDKH
jgi:hypothetical protein